MFRHSSDPSAAATSTMQASDGDLAVHTQRQSVVDALSAETPNSEVSCPVSADSANVGSLPADSHNIAGTPDDTVHVCSVPICEGNDRVCPVSADLTEDLVAPNAANGKEKCDDADTCLRLIYSWCFPPMKPYDELCANVEIRSFGLFHTSTCFRRGCIYAVKSKAFERISLFLILANCVFLAMDSNAPDFQHTQLGGVLQAAELVFIIAFTVEMALKMLGLGLYGAKGAYLRDAWNVIDFIVVVMGWMSLLPSIENISSMRTVRVLRPLRTITGVEGMRMLVSTLLGSLPMLLDVLILCAFLFLIFGTIGVQTFAGVLRQHCGIPVGGITAGQVLHNVTSFVHLSEDVCGDGIIKLPGQGAWFSTNGVLSLLMLMQVSHAHSWVLNILICYLHTVTTSYAMQYVCLACQDVCLTCRNIIP